jgi:uncharacterized membrane protein YoaK (UPF0700 family)
MGMLFGFILSFIAGFVDTATFVGARGVLSAHVTGNFVLFGVALVKGVHDLDYLKLFLFIPFVATLIGVSRLSRVARISDRFESTMLFAASFILVVPGFYFLGVTNLEDKIWDISNVLIMFPVVAMAIQNAVCKIAAPTDPMTTVMTGNVTQMALEFIGYKGQVGDKVSHRPKLYSILRVILGFAVGCFSGAWMVTNYSLGALLIPAFLFLALAIYKRNLNK